MKLRRTESAIAGSLAVALCLQTTTVSAQGKPVKEIAPTETADPAREEARAAFLEGTKLAAETRWAEALAAFERAEARIPHAITSFNIGVCERALGRYTAARETFQRALAEDRARSTTLPERLKQDTEGYLKEIEALLVRVTVTVKPASASLAVDGRPLSIVGPDKETGELPVAIAGLRPPGKGEPIPAKRFTLEMDFGRHVLTFSRAGHSDGIVAQDFAPGVAPPLELSLDELPATIQISADQPGALVTVEGRDLGPVPITLRRPAGSYRVIVEKDGFIDADAQLVVKAGEQASFKAKLPIDEPSIAEKWWFWTLAGVAVTGIGVGTYFIAREATREPTRPTLGGGTLGWRVPIQ
jgi:hypothetical protein